MNLFARSILALAFVCSARADVVDLAATGTTTVTLDAGFVALVTGAGITPSETGTGTLAGLLATFPITGGTLDTNSGDLIILHEGSGLQFASMSGVVTTGNFIVNTAAGFIYGDVTAPGGVNVADAPIFAIGPGLTLSLTEAASGVFTGAFGTPSLTGTLVGSAATTPSPVPEPGTVALIGAGLGGVALLRRRAARA